MQHDALYVALVVLLYRHSLLDVQDVLAQAEHLFASFSHDY